MTNIENINWDFVQRSVLNKKCILFLGPGITVNYGNNARMEQKFEELTNDASNDILSFHKKDGFLIFKNENAKLLNQDKIASFFNADYKNPLLEKIAEIPFHLIINVTPDKTMCKIFENKQFTYKTEYYSMKRLRQIEQAPDTETPLIYNLFGSVDDAETLIISHYDLFRYLKSVYAFNNLPDIIKSATNKENTNNIIFLGFEFDRWYYQLIINLLNLNFDPCIRYASIQNELDDEIKTLYESHFGINFASRDLKMFVDKLHSCFAENQLRKPPQTGEKPRKYLKTNIIKFINAAFNATDLDTLCMCYFDEVYNQFTSEQSKLTRINILMDYVAKNNLFNDLLDNGKEQNSVQFEKFAPYYE